MLVLSTGHLPQQVMQVLENESAKNSHLTRNIAHEYGAIIYTEEPREGTPPELITVIQYAKSVGCLWINFDRDADTIDGLPTWSW